MLVGVDFSSCYGNDGETCEVVCIPGFSVTAEAITCTSGQWNNKEPCRFGRYLICVYSTTGIDKQKFSA